MLRCTAIINDDEKKSMNVPVLPLVGQMVSFSHEWSSNSYLVTQIEYVIKPSDGTCTAINIHMVSE